MSRVDGYSSADDQLQVHEDMAQQIGDCWSWASTMLISDDRELLLFVEFNPRYVVDVVLAEAKRSVQ